MTTPTTCVPIRLADPWPLSRSAFPAPLRRDAPFFIYLFILVTSPKDYTSHYVPCYGALMVTPDLATYSSDAFIRFKVSWARCFLPSAAAAATVYFCVGDIVRFPAVLVVVVGGGVGGVGDKVGVGVDVGGVGGEWHLSFLLLVLLVGSGVDVFVCVRACVRVARPSHDSRFRPSSPYCDPPPRTSTSSRIFSSP